jgi:hypothetical protein
LREEMRRRSAPVSHRAPRHFPPSVEAGLRACGIGAYRLPGSSRSQWQGLESDAKRLTGAAGLIRPRHLPLRGQQRLWKDFGLGKGRTPPNPRSESLPHLFPVSPRREQRAGTPRTSALIVQHKSQGSTLRRHRESTLKTNPYTLT